MTPSPLNDLFICIKGAGEMASGVAWRLHRSNFRRLLMLETETPLAVRRRVSFCEAVSLGETQVEGTTAVRTAGDEDLNTAWRAGHIPVLIDPRWRSIDRLKPDVLVDAIIAKRNLGTRSTDAPLVIGLGPGFTAGLDVHRAVETNRGHHLGRLLASGSPEPDTGIPGVIAGFGIERIVRAPVTGRFTAHKRIGETVRAGEAVGEVDGVKATVRIGGVLRGIIRSGVAVDQGLKLGDVDPRGDAAHCHTLSDKARAIGGAVLEAILERFNV
jgi:xanthine dehydrogenase accessory factor